MRSEKYGFDPNKWKIFNVQPCSGRFVMDKNYIYMVTSIVTAALIRPLYEDGYHQIENIYLADAFADDVNEIATRYYNPEDVHLIFDDFCLRWKLKYTWDEGSWDEDYGMEQDLDDTVGILIANNVPISKEVREFMSEPFSMKRVREYYPDTKRWGTIENPKD